ncbi:PII-like signaling protein [Deinococcus sp. UYEF24]
MTWEDLNGRSAAEDSSETTDQIHGETAFDRLIQVAKRSGLRSDTVIQGNVGFGSTVELNRSSLLHFAQNLPVTGELIRRREDQPLLDDISPHLSASLLVTTQNVRTLQTGP